LTHFDEILQEADGIILSRGNLGIDLPPEKVRFFDKRILFVDWRALLVYVKKVFITSNIIDLFS